MTDPHLRSCTVLEKLAVEADRSALLTALLRGSGEVPLSPLPEPETASAPAPGFGLKAKKTAPAASESKPLLTVQSQAPALAATLHEWFAAAYDARLETGESGLLVTFYDIRYTARPALAYPVLAVPVELVPQSSRGVFHIKRSVHDLFFVEEAGKLFQKNGASLPALADFDDDLQPEKLFRDLEDCGVGLADMALQPSVQLVRVRYNLRTLARQAEPPAEPLRLQHISQPLSGLLASQRAVMGPAIEARQPLTSDDPDIRLDAAVQAALAATLEQAPVLVLAESNRQLADVQKRIAARGAGRFVFPLFAAADRVVFREAVASVVDQVITPPPAVPGEPELQARRFFDALTQKRTAYQISAAELAQQLLDREQIPDIPLAFPSIQSRTQQDIAALKQRLSGYRAAEKNVDAAAFWAQVHAAALSKSSVTELQGAVDEALGALEFIRSEVRRAAEKTGLEEPQTLTDLSVFEKRIEELQKAPVFPRSVFHHEWNPIPEKLRDLLKLVAQAKLKQEEIASVFHPQILDEHLEELLPRLQSQSLSPMRFLNHRYKKELTRLKAYALAPDSFKKIETFWEKLQAVRSQQKLLRRIAETRDAGERLFGRDWNGIQSDPDELMAKAQWLESFDKRRMNRFFVSEDTLHGFLSSTERALFNTTVFRQRLRELDDAIRHLLLRLLLDSAHPLHQVRTRPFAELEQDLALLRTNLDTFEAWQQHKDEHAIFEEPPLSEFLSVVRDRADIRPERYPDVFEKSFFAGLLQRMLADEPELQRFTFRNLKEITDALNRETARLRATGPFLIGRHLEVLRLNRMNALEQEPSFAFIQHELKKSTRFMPVAPFLQRAGKALVSHAPLWLIRPEQLHLVEDLLPLFRAAILLELSDRTAEPVRAALAGQHVLTIGGRVPAKKAGLTLGRKAEAPAESSVLIPPTRLNDPWKRPRYETVATQPFANGSVPFELFEILHDTSLNGLISVVLPDEASLQNFWQQCATLISTDPLMRAWYERPGPARTIRFTSAFSVSDVHSDHAIVVMKKPASAPKPGLGFGIKKTPTEAGPAPTPDFPAPLLARIPGRILLLGEPGTDAAGYMVPPAPPLTNRFTALIRSIGEPPADWDIEAGHHRWEATLRHRSTGRRFYILADLPDENAPVLPDRMEFAGNSSDAVLAFSALTALRDRETAIDRVFELAESLNSPVESVPDPLPEPVPESPDAGEADNTLPQAPAQPEGFERWLREPDPQRVPQYERITSRQDIQKADPALLPRFVPYTMYDGVIMGDRQDFFEAPERRIQKLIGEIVDTEAPIHINNLYRAVTAYWQIQRRDAHVQSVFSRQFSECLRKKRVFMRDAAVYASEHFPVTPRSRALILEFTTADEMPLDEIQAAVFAILEKTAPLEQADLMESTAWCFGLPVGFPGFERRFEKALALMGDRKIAAWYKTAVLLHPDVDPRKKIVGLG